MMVMVTMMMHNELVKGREFRVACACLFNFFISS